MSKSPIVQITMCCIAVRFRFFFAGSSTAFFGAIHLHGKDRKGSSSRRHVLDNPSIKGTNPSYAKSGAKASVVKDHLSAATEFKGTQVEMVETTNSYSANLMLMSCA